MADQSDLHLARMADDHTVQRLERLGFNWDLTDANACAALRFKRAEDSPPAVVGLIGGASSGKSTVFNSLLGWEFSRISAHAHETLGPVAAVPNSWLERLASRDGSPGFLPGLERQMVLDQNATAGQVGFLAVCAQSDPDLENLILIDLPDVTSKMSADEGSAGRTFLPWMDGVLVVVDEERWFDAVVLQETAGFARNFGPRIWVVFNRTESAASLTSEQRSRLQEQARAHHADSAAFSPYRPGSGYRPVAEETSRDLKQWIKDLSPGTRRPLLQNYIQRQCAQLSRENVTRSEGFGALCRKVDKELSALAEQASLSLDLLTPEERSLLGIGRKLVPLYDAMSELRRWMRKLGFQRSGKQIAFEKRGEELASVLRRNLEHRFGHATDRVTRIVAESPYLEASGDSWRPAWEVPQFDEHEWATRIRAHIDEWKKEMARQSHRSDVAALTFGTPLLLADLLFLGGTGLTLTWATAWVAAFLGGKSLASLVQGSPAFEQYQTTVRAYQSFLREALSQQWQANLEQMPRRHLPMSDPVAESVMYLSVPGR